MTHRDLTPDQRQILVAHFMSEFGDTEAQAIADIEAYEEGDGLEIHLDAALHGYM